MVWCTVESHAMYAWVLPSSDDPNLMTDQGMGKKAPLSPELRTILVVHTCFITTYDYV